MLTRHDEDEIDNNCSAEVNALTNFSLLYFVIWKFSPSELNSVHRLCA